MTSRSGSDRFDSTMYERLKQTQERFQQPHREKGGRVKNALYCSTCEAELDEPNGACEFCARADAVLGNFA